MRGSPYWRVLRGLGGLESINPPIGWALADCALQGHRSAFPVGDGAGIVTEVKFSTVARQVRFAHMVIGSDHAALQNGKEVFNRVAMLEAPGVNILAGTVIDRAVSGELAPDAGIDHAFVCH